MFVTVKRKTIIATVVLVITIALTCVMLSYTSAPAALVPENGRTIVVDAGHGGVDGGVVGTTYGSVEADINLGVAKSLRHFLARGGYKVVMTRENSDGLYGLSAANKKQSDMAARRDVITQAKPDLTVSIHQNHYPLSSVCGAQVFYKEDCDISAEIAKTMQSTLNTQLGYDRPQKQGDYYVLSCTDTPAVLVECGFLSNPAEEQRLSSAAYQEKIAYLIYSAIEAHFANL